MFFLESRFPINAAFGPLTLFQELLHWEGECHAHKGRALLLRPQCSKKDFVCAYWRRLRMACQVMSSPYINATPFPPSWRHASTRSGERRTPQHRHVATSRRRAEESERGRSCLVGASAAPSLPVKMSSVSCATLNRSKSVFVGGGEDGSFQDVLTTVYQLDSGSDRWTELPPCSEPVAYFSLAAAGDRLHMLGGMYSSNKRPAGAGTISQSVYTLGQDGEWVCRLPPMTIPRCSAGAMGYGQLIVIAGGSSLKGRTASVEAIHLGSSVPHWVQLPPLPQVLDSPQVVITGERLLVGLGCTESGVANTTLYEASLADVRTHMSQPSRRQKGNVFWRVLCSVPLKMAALSSCMGTVVAVGCERDSREQNASVLAYSSNKQVWDPVVRLPSARSKAGIVSLDGPSPSLMVLGGCSREKGSIREVDIVHLQPLQ